MTATWGARTLGVTPQALNNIVNGKSGISPEMAIRLSKAFGSSPKSRLKMQLDYYLARARLREQGGGVPGSQPGFFPFRDGVDVRIRQGVKTVVQPGGSMKGWQVIEACKEAGVTMVFTGQRAFKH